MTSGRPDVSTAPNPGGREFLERMRRLAMTDTDGPSPSGPIYFRFTGPVASVSTDPMRRVDPASAIVLVDIDPLSPRRGVRHPCHVQVTREADRFRPAHLVQLLPVPGLPLREGTLHAAIVLTRLGGESGGALATNDRLGRLLAGNASPSDPTEVAWARSLAPLARELPSLGIPAQEVAAATVFRTGRPTDRLFRFVHAADGSAARSPNGPLAIRGDYPAYRAFVGEWSAPVYQEGGSPYPLAGGGVRGDASGRPIRVGEDRAPFALGIPGGKMPAAGFPLVLYVHGTGGLSTQVLDRGKVTTPGGTPAPGSGPAAWVAEKGWAAASTALPFAKERLGFLAADGYIAYNFTNPVAMRDNFVQMVLELVHFRHLLLALSIDPAICPGTDASDSPDGRVRFDPRHVVVMGQSLGSYLSGMLAATLGGFEGAILTGAGGSWIEFPFGPKDPMDLQLFLENLAYPGERVPLDRFHPLVFLFDLAVGGADNVHYVRTLLDEPRAGPPPHVLVVEGYDDHQVPTNLQRALVLAAGVDLAGGDPGPSPDESLTPVLPWAGLRQLAYPARANRIVSGYGPRTAVAVRYLMDPISNEGHFVVYQLDQPRRQIQGFLETLIKDGVPTVPR